MEDNWRAVYVYPHQLNYLFIICTLLMLTNGILDGNQAITNTNDLPFHIYDRIYYKTEGQEHLIQKRSLLDGIGLDFYSLRHKRDFKLNLILDESVFHPNIQIENTDGVLNHELHISKNLAVKGNLDGDENSYIRGILNSDGTFDGILKTGKGEIFHIEPSTRYISNSFKINGESLLYRKEDIILPESIRSLSCQSHLLHLNRLNNNSEAYESVLHRNRLNLLGTKKIYPSNVQEYEDLKIAWKGKRRDKRWVIDSNKKTCMLYLQADYLFYKKFGSEESSINIMTQHIQHLNDIFQNTDFNMDGKRDDIQFMIKRIKIYTKNSTLDRNYAYDGNFEVIKFLEVFSEGDYDAFCLAYLFTYRDFEGGTLGLAWTGDLKNAGGVCEKKGHFRGGIKSLNTGIITLLNYGKLVSPPVSYVTLAHEIGHNFGSPHDPENDRLCTPGGDDGNYIMFARATAGDKRNNNKFSICSLKSINPVLSVKARDAFGCFQEPQKAICGNGVVEEGEECDCGWEEDCKEACCYPMRRTSSWFTFGKIERLHEDGKPCSLRRGASCSPSAGPCCTSTCTFIKGDKCRDDNGCRNSAYCNGLSSECPQSIFKSNKTICDKHSSVCFMGECTGSICLAYGLESCQCTEEYYDRSTKLCEVCCRIPGESKCISTFDWNEDPYDMPNVNSKPGTPCRNYTGYCDANSICREVDPSGPLATLRKLLYADEGLATIAEWIDQHWYIIIGIVFILLILMGLTLRASRNKKLRRLTLMHSNVEAIQIQRTYLEDLQGGGASVVGGTATTVHPMAVRKKIPFKKKVRDRRTKRSRTSGTNDGGIEKKKDTKERRLLWNKGIKKNTGPVEADLIVIGDNAVREGNPSSSQHALPSSSSLNLIQQSPLNHTHEVKSAVVPKAKRKYRKGRRASSNSAAPTNTHGPSRKSNKKAKVSSQSGKSPKKQTKSSEKNRNKTSSNSGQNCNSTSVGASSASGEASSSKRSIQVVYTPPFSVKVEFLQDPSAKSTKTKSSASSSTTGNTSGRKKEARKLDQRKKSAGMAVANASKKGVASSAGIVESIVGGNGGLKSTNGISALTNSIHLREPISILDHKKNRSKGKKSLNSELQILIPPNKGNNGKIKEDEEGGTTPQSN